jgi:serine/threonine-protein kinase
VVLPFTGLKYPVHMAVDSAGNLYVTDTYNNRVVKLPAG